MSAATINLIWAFDPGVGREVVGAAGSCEVRQGMAAALQTDRGKCGGAFVQPVGVCTRKPWRTYPPDIDLKAILDALAGKVTSTFIRARRPA